MNAAKTTKIIFWVATVIIFLFEGVVPALTGNSELAKEGVRHLGYPDYFRVQLNIFKAIGAIVLVLPGVKGRFKEWAYAGFGITMISAFIGHTVVDGLGFQAVFPLIIFGILVTSYVCYHKMCDQAESRKQPFGEMANS